MRWRLPEHGAAGLLVEAFSVAADDVDTLIDNLSATVVSKETFDAVLDVYRDYTGDDPLTIEIVTEAPSKRCEDA